MCEECPEQVIKLAQRLSAYIDAHSCSVTGSLHHVLEDENVTTGHIESGLDRGQWPNLPTDEETIAIGRELLAMTITERHQVIRMAWDPPNVQPWREDY